MLALYRLATIVLGPLVVWHLRRRMARGKEDRARFGERLGIPGRPRPAGPLIWVHGASVGEAVSVLPLIEALRGLRPDVGVLLTTGTVTSARLMADRLPQGAFHQFVPVDRPAWVRRFVDHWRPDLVLWAESEFWPNLIGESTARGIPLVLVNGRVSARSFERWHRLPRTIGRLLSGFALCLGQTEEDARRLAALGARRALSVGNLKFAAPPLPADDGALETLRRLIGARPRWLAASTHPGEEALAGRVHAALRERHPDLLTIIVPRHPERGAAIAAELAAHGPAVARRAAGEAPGPDTGLYVADTLGELGLFYRLAPIVVMGKSLVGRGGQNPLEPARLGCAVLHGPAMDNFAAIAEEFGQAGAALTVDGEAELVVALDRLFGQPGEVARLGAAARAVAEGKATVLGAVLDRLAPFIDALPRGGRDAGA